MFTGVWLLDFDPDWPARWRPGERRRPLAVYLGHHDFAGNALCGHLVCHYSDLTELLKQDGKAVLCPWQDSNLRHTVEEELRPLPTRPDGERNFLGEATR
jgi:hypothetical protein